MKIYKKISIISILVLLVGLAGGCIGGDKIGDILKNPDQYNGKNVSIRGNVIDTLSIPLVSQGAYKIDDGTGSIWVVTSTGTPGKGETISVKGTVNKGFKIESTDLGTVIVEKSRQS